MGAGRFTEADIEKLAMSLSPATLPRAAWGDLPVQWVTDPQDVWVWVSWPHKLAERLPGVAIGWNDRVVVVDVRNRHGRWQVTVWRNAVSRRSAG